MSWTLSLIMSRIFIINKINIFILGVFILYFSYSHMLFVSMDHSYSITFQIFLLPLLHIDMLFHFILTLITQFQYYLWFMQLLQILDHKPTFSLPKLLKIFSMILQTSSLKIRMTPIKLLYVRLIYE